MRVIPDFFKNKASLFTLLYAAVTLLFISRHELFNDELYVWTVLQNIPLADIPEHVTVDGQPLIFFLLLAPFAKAGLPVEFLQFLCWAASVTAVFLLYRFAPFSWPVKAAISISAPMLYWYPVVARSYSFFPPLAFGLAVLFPKTAELSREGIKSSNRRKYGIMLLSCCILAGMTPNIHFVFDMFGGMTFIYFAYDQFVRKHDFSRLNIAAAGIFVFLLAVPAVQTVIASHADVEYARTTPFSFVIEDSLKTSVDFFSSSLNSALNTSSLPFINNIVPVHLLLFCILLVILFRYSRRIFFFVLIPILFHISICILKYPVFYPFRTYTIHIILVTGLWIFFNIVKLPDHIKKFSEILISVFMLCTFPTAVEIIILDYNRPFSAEKRITDYIKKNIPAASSSKIYVFDSPRFAATGYYLPDRDMFTVDDQKVKIASTIAKRPHPKPETPAFDEKTNKYTITVPEDEHKYERLEKILCIEDAIVLNACIYKITK